MWGKNITMAGDPLARLQWDQLFTMISSPSNELKSQIEQLRMIMSIDMDSYRRLKKALPYIVNGVFDPPYRKSENFASISSFILDIDHVKSKGFNVQELKTRLKQDERIFMMFVSPSNDGLKVLFRLSDKCYDRGRYSLFYKLFARSFSMQYGLNQIIDNRTSDVTRACFLSFDEAIIVNEHAETVRIESFVDFNNELEVNDAEQMLKTEGKKDALKSKPEQAEKKDLSIDVLASIKATLNPKTQVKYERKVYVPEELNQILDAMRKELAKHEIGVASVENIQYGKKIKVEVKHIWAEVNVFYGKKGFSVVKTPKRGSNEELADISWQIISDFLFLR